MKKVIISKSIGKEFIRCCHTQKLDKFYKNHKRKIKYIDRKFKAIVFPEEDSNKYFCIIAQFIAHNFTLFFSIFPGKSKYTGEDQNLIKFFDSLSTSYSSNVWSQFYSQNERIFDYIIELSLVQEILIVKFQGAPRVEGAIEPEITKFGKPLILSNMGSGYKCLSFCCPWCIPKDPRNRPPARNQQPICTISKQPGLSNNHNPVDYRHSVSDTQRDQKRASLKRKDHVQEEGQLSSIINNKYDEDFENITSNLNDITYQPNKMNSLKREEEAERDVKDYSKEMKTTLKDIQKNYVDMQNKYDFERNKQQESMKKRKEKMNMIIKAREEERRKERRKKPIGIPKTDYVAEEEFRRKLKEQEDRFMEELNEMRRKREELRKEQEAEMRRMNENAKRQLMMFIKLIATKAYLEEKKDDWERYLQVIRMNINKIRIEFGNFESTHHKYLKNGERMDNMETMMFEMDYMHLYSTIKLTYDFLADEYFDAKNRVRQYPEATFLRIILSRIVTAANILCTIAYYISEFKNNDQSYPNLNQLLNNLDCIPTTSELIKMNNNEKYGDYQHIPSLNMFPNVRISTVI